MFVRARLWIAGACFVLLTACSHAPKAPELPDPEASTSAAAVGSVVFWRWLGRLVLQTAKNTRVNVNVDANIDSTTKPEPVKPSK